MHVLLMKYQGMAAGADNRQKLACCHRKGAAPPLGVWPTVKVAVASPEGATLWSLKVTTLAFGRPMMGSGVSMKSICLCISACSVSNNPFRGNKSIWAASQFSI